MGGLYLLLGGLVWCWRWSFRDSLDRTVEVDDLFEVVRVREVIDLDFDAVLSGGGDTDSSDIGHALEEGLVDLDVADVVVDDFGG